MWLCIKKTTVWKISVADRRRLYLKSTKEDSLKYSFYGSMNYQLHEANQEATGLVDFIFRALGIIGSSGIQYLQDCPKQPNIPVYLLVGGAFGLIKVISMGWRQTRKRNYEQTIEALADGNEDEVLANTSSNITDYALSVFLLVWFILGNYWVLVIYKPRYDPLLHDPNNWCAKTVYLFSVIHLYICYGVMALVVVLLSFIVLCIRSCGVYAQNV
ncbi:uncharacterized protein LOC106478115 isoform X1 [Limulus polyphemus]|uniref:Uncharacterized protein LOC106478115 isoform X1 n=2 Tax=Limulus polyphemus TaxID=6850 RepID=A0ABM1S154_LIMPO|nr:uncharacterized protein LOC106478115 isoform X1 [Limulus polyphemus]